MILAIRNVVEQHYQVVLVFEIRCVCGRNFIFKSVEEQYRISMYYILGVINISASDEVAVKLYKKNYRYDHII
jgi:hypothetical protein